MGSARYQVCEWHHGFENEPIRIWTEIEADGWEIRKVEIYRDGSVDIAAVVDQLLFETGNSVLSEAPIPSMAEVNSGRQFVATPTSSTRFEAVWAGAMSEPRVRARLSDSQSMAYWVEMSALVDVHLDPEREKSIWGTKNRSVLFRFTEREDPPVNLMVEFTTEDGSDIEPGSTASNVKARFLGPLWMTSVVVEGATFGLEMGGLIGSGVVRQIEAGPQYRRP